MYEMESGFSFAEKLYFSTLEEEQELGVIPDDFSPMDKLKEIKKGQEYMLKYANPELAIRAYLLGSESGDGFLNETLYNEKYNCVGETAIFLSLAEQMDTELFNKCHVGSIHYDYCNLSPFEKKKDGHVFVMKDSDKEVEIIDYGKNNKEEHYIREFNNLPVKKPKEYLISCALNSCALKYLENIEVFKSLSLFQKAKSYGDNKVVNMNESMVHRTIAGMITDYIVKEIQKHPEMLPQEVIEKILE